MAVVLRLGEREIDLQTVRTAFPPAPKIAGFLRAMEAYAWNSCCRDVKTMMNAKPSLATGGCHLRSEACLFSSPEQRF